MQIIELVPVSRSRPNMAPLSWMLKMATFAAMAPIWLMAGRSRCGFHRLSLFPGPRSGTLFFWLPDRDHIQRPL